MLLDAPRRVARGVSWRYRCYGFGSGVKHAVPVGQNPYVRRVGSGHDHGQTV